MQWQPIETAPKLGTEVLISAQDGICVAFWDEEWGEWTSDLRGKGCGQWAIGARHWMPLPEPPKGDAM